MFGTSRDARAVAEASQACLHGVARGLSLGPRLPSLAGFQGIPGLSALAPGEASWDGALWRVEGGFAQGLGWLRPRLQPGARLMCLVELVPSWWQVVRAWFGGKKPPRYSREGICEELLLAGFCSPRVWFDSTRLLAVSARLPSVPDRLDEVFAQPARARSDTTP
jgi:hypothetical protein